MNRPEVEEFLGLVGLASSSSCGGGESRPLLKGLLSDPLLLRRIHASCGHDYALLTAFYTACRTLSVVGITLDIASLTVTLDAACADTDDATSSPYAWAAARLIMSGGLTIDSGDASQLLLSYQRPCAAILWVCLHHITTSETLRETMRHDLITDSGHNVVTALNAFSSYTPEYPHAVMSLLATPSTFPETLYSSDRGVLCDVFRRERRDSLVPATRHTLTRLLYALDRFVRPPAKTATSSDVARWLSSLQLCEDYGEVCVAQGIDGDVINCMSEDEWKQCGVESSYDRQRILEELFCLEVLEEEE